MTKQLKILTLGYLCIMLLFALGYVQCIIPQQKNILHLQGILTQVVTVRKSVNPKTVKTPIFDAKKEVLRWLSDEGRILSWKKQATNYSFVWIGSYQAMLLLIKNWPQHLQVNHMHWEKSKNSAIKWRGSYALVS